jgi:hypothetical protein
MLQMQQMGAIHESRPQLDLLLVYLSEGTCMETQTSHECTHDMGVECLLFDNCSHNLGQVLQEPHGRLQSNKKNRELM